ncbi:MAG: hypothetical protein M3O25_04850, partial [Actinomycetota bacterium]|nr:hypothetical protein [Actinomycetota bacterium]
MSGLAIVLASLALAGAQEAPTAYEATVHVSGKIGSRPAGGARERRAHAYAEKTFRAAGLDVTVSPFRV